MLAKSVAVPLFFVTNVVAVVIHLASLIITVPITANEIKVTILRIFESIFFFLFLYLYFSFFKFFSWVNQIKRIWKLTLIGCRFFFSWGHTSLTGHTSRPYEVRHTTGSYRSACQTVPFFFFLPFFSSCLRFPFFSTHSPTSREFHFILSLSPSPEYKNPLHPTLSLHLTTSHPRCMTLLAASSLFGVASNQISKKDTISRMYIHHTHAGFDLIFFILDRDLKFRLEK